MDRDKKMSKENVVLVELSDLIQQEKWTSVPLNSFTLTHFEKLDNLLQRIQDEKLIEEASQVVKEFLKENKDPKKGISAQYVLGFLDIYKGSLDDSVLINLMDLFASHYKPTIVEYIGERVSQVSDNKVILRILSKIYETTGQEVKKQEVWEKLARIDLEDTESVRNLALLYDAQGKTEEAHEFFKKALHRYIEARNFSGVREIWIKLLPYSDQDFDFFLAIEKKVSRVFDGTDVGTEAKEKRTNLILEDLYRSLSSKGLWDKAFIIVKIMLRYSPNNHNYRRDLINCLKEIYKDNPNVETFLVKSHLNTNSRNVFEGLEDFEKRMFFAKGNFVYHKTWNVGVIREVDEENLIIDFVQKRGHSLSLSMAMDVLESLDKHDIRVYKAVWSKEKLKAKVESDVRWGIVTILKSYGSVSLKMMKSELYPSIFKENEWNNWSLKAKDILEKDAFFAKSIEKPDHFIMRSHSITFDEKKYMEFKTTSQFFNRYKIFTEFMKDSSEGLSSEYFVDMFSYFASFLRTFNKIDSEILASYLLVDKYLSEYSFLRDQVTLPSFTDIIKDPSDASDLFEGLEGVDLKRDCLNKIFQEVPNWEIIFSRIFPTSLAALNKRIFELLEKNKPNFFKAMLKNITERSGDKKEAYFFIIRSYDEFKGYMDISSDQRLIKLLDMLAQTNSEISAKKESSANKKLQKNILSFLYEEGFLSEALRENSSLEFAQKVYEILKEFPSLPPKQLIETQKIIKAIHKDFVFEEMTTSSKTKEADNTFYTLLSSFSTKQRELQHIKLVEMPKNSQDIGEAMALGDLKENAEYHSAKERQTLLTAKSNQLSVELDRAKVVNEEEGKKIKGDVVSFGTKVFLINHLKGDQVESYSILGPWESNPDEGIVSYKSPFGAQFLNAKKGEKLKFSINTHDSDYTVKEIEVLPLSLFSFKD